MGRGPVTGRFLIVSADSKHKHNYSCCTAMGRVRAFLGNSEQQAEEEEEEEGQKDRILMNTTGSLAA